MKRLLKIATIAFTLMLMLSALASCKIIDDLRGGDDGGETPPPTPSYTVTFNLDGGTAPSEFSSSLTVKSGTAISLQTPTKEGHTFLGWYNGETKFEDGTALTANTDLVAKWEIKKLKITFVDNNDILGEQMFDWGTIPAVPTAPEKEEHIFGGWFKDSELENKYNFDVALYSDITIYARMLNGYTEISSEKELDAIRVNPSGKYLLACNIDLKEVQWTPIDSFSGILDGNGYRIYNFGLSSTEGNIGFIKVNDGTVENIEFDTFTVVYNHDCNDGTDAFAGIVAAQNNGTIKNCRITKGSILMTVSIYNKTQTRYAYMGSIAGLNTGSVTECENNVDLSFGTSCTEDNSYYYKTYDYIWYNEKLYSSIGGIVGENRGLLSANKATGLIASDGRVAKKSNSNVENHIYLGGIAGKNTTETAVISNCASYVNIKTNYSGSANIKYADIGLLLGRNEALVTNCFASGDLEIKNSDQLLAGTVGGAVGYNQTFKEINNIVANINITVGDSISSAVGGIIGQNKINGISKKMIFVGNIKIGTSVANYGFATGLQEGSLYLVYYSNDCKLTVGELETADGSCTAGERADISTLRSFNFIFGEPMLWNEDVWQINEGENPTLKYFS